MKMFIYRSFSNYIVLAHSIEDAADKIGAKIGLTSGRVLLKSMKEIAGGMYILKRRRRKKNKTLLLAFDVSYCI